MEYFVDIKRVSWSKKSQSINYDNKICTIIYKQYLFIVIFYYIYNSLATLKIPEINI